ncbi:MAG: metallophosphoesterase family protein [Thermomicrobiales bacterium]
MSEYIVAVLSDMHGNAAALEAVLADLAAQLHDATVFAGDLIMNGPRPAETLAAVRGLGVPTVHGNTEPMITDRDNPDPVARWVRERLTEDDLAYLAALPFSHRITPPGGESPRDDLFIVHATPTDVDTALFTELLPGQEAIAAITPEDKAIALLGDARANLILYGHIHFFSSGTVGGRRVASIGSVGYPADGDQRAAYALVTWDGQNWRVTPRRVPYDVDAVIAEYADLDIPRKAIFIRRLAEAIHVAIA